jgi:hypothetical protein
MLRRGGDHEVYTNTGVHSVYHQTTTEEEGKHFPVAKAVGVRS